MNDLLIEKPRSINPEIELISDGLKKDEVKKVNSEKK